MSETPQPPRFAGLEELAAYVESQRLPLLAYIDRNLGPALRRKLEPEDILQEILVTAMSAPAQFEISGRDPFKLLCQIAEQRIIDAHRHHVAAQKRRTDRERSLDAPVSGSQPFGFLNQLIASLTSPSQAFSRDQKEFRLQQAIADLAADQREALRLRFVEGWPSKQIAEHLGKTDGAIRVLLSRTLSRLQELLADH